jgi:uncharacterized protein (DUF433 family)
MSPIQLSPKRQKLMKNNEMSNLRLSKLKPTNIRAKIRSLCSAVERDPLKVSGAWVFRGTRVPVAALFENLEDGAQLADFVSWFPGVTLEQARAVLEHAASTLKTA